jgi:hypothetical protein
MKIFSGIFTRMHRGMCAELAKIMVINKLYLQQTPHWKALTEGDNAIIAPSDYTGAGFRVYPATDPTMVSETQRQANATMVLQASMQNPGYDRYLVNKEFLEAYSYPNIEMVLPDPKGDNAIQPPPNPKVELDKAKLQLDTQRFELEKQQFQQDQQSAMIELQQEAMLNQAKVMELQAKATALLAEAEGAETGHQIALINAQIGAAKAHMDGVFRALAVMQKGIDQRQHAAKEGIPHGQGADAAGKAAAGMAGVDTSPANSKNAQMAQGAPA